MDAEIPQLRMWGPTGATQDLLEHLDEPTESSFYPRWAKVAYVCQLLGKAMVKECGEMSQELGEAYLQDGIALQSYPEFERTSLYEYRRRRGIYPTEPPSTA